MCNNLNYSEKAINMKPQLLLAYNKLNLKYGIEAIAVEKHSLMCKLI